MHEGLKCSKNAKTKVLIQHMVKDPTLRISQEPGSHFPGVLLGPISNKELNGAHDSIVDMALSHRSILSL